MDLKAAILFIIFDIRMRTVELLDSAGISPCSEYVTNGTDFIVIVDSRYKGHKGIRVVRLYLFLSRSCGSAIGIIIAARLRFISNYPHLNAWFTGNVRGFLACLQHEINRNFSYARTSSQVIIILQILGLDINGSRPLNSGIRKRNNCGVRRTVMHSS